MASNNNRWIVRLWDLCCGHKIWCRPLAKVDAINSQSCPGHLNDRRRRWVHVICGKVEIVNHQRVWARSNGVRGIGNGENLLFKILYFYSIKDFKVNHEGGNFSWQTCQLLSSLKDNVRNKEEKEHSSPTLKTIKSTPTWTVVGLLLLLLLCRQLPN